MSNDSKGKGKAKAPLEIDYLFEDPVIPSQAYCLLTVVGPNCKAKCDVWGVKFRGCSDSIENASKMAKRLERIDPHHEIWVVETGKFMPLVVDPNANIPTEYANEALNKVMKGYLENNEKATDEWTSRKNERVAKAIKEGKEGAPKDVFTSLVTVKTVEQKILQLEQQRDEMRVRLDEADEVFESFTKEEQESALKEFDIRINKKIEDV